MGLTNRSVGRSVAAADTVIEKASPTDTVIALAGNPNVGKSTVFNGLTGMHQHTGNWPGKTVANVQGICRTDNHRHILVDIPGTYSLMARSAEEEVARDFICSGIPDAVVVVCDATCLERNLNLVLQIMEVSSRVVICVNLMDEAKRRHIEVNTHKLSAVLGVPVVGISARNKSDLNRLMCAIDDVLQQKPQQFRIRYAPEIEHAVKLVLPALRHRCSDRDARWTALKILEADESIDSFLSAPLQPVESDTTLQARLSEARQYLTQHGVSGERFIDLLASAPVKRAESIAAEVVTYRTSGHRSYRLDRILTGRVSGYLVMLILLACIFWLTITGANYPSQVLSAGLFWIQDRLTEWFQAVGAPDWLHGALVLGVYRVLAWVVSVMLPPMAVFFPLFTLLEDAGYLPRIAYNLDKPFARCHACGKQALTMCMGFGCNAAGVVGCRIIDSPRERLLAILTNSFVPCNGRFPALIALIGMFFITTGNGLWASVRSALLLTAVILLGIGATFGATKLLSCTILKGTPSAFTLELPPFRRPQILKVFWRSLWERTIFVLGRAIAVAAPAGLLIWLAANIHVNGISILQIGADFLDPFAQLMGMDGVILIAFILGFPANEIVVPIIIMAYTASGTLIDMSDLTSMKQLFIEHGWTPFTAISVMLFSLFHWPCSTTLITIKKETGSLKWTALSAALPTVIGIAVCILFTAITKLFI